MKVKVIADLYEKKSELDKAQFKKWIRVLRSGRYSQCRESLQDSSGFCCLGVACDIFIPKKEIRKTKAGNISGNMPEDQKFSPKWLKKISEDFERRQNYINQKTDSEYETSVDIAQMNDSLKLNFDAIADVLELVYVHGILEGEN